MARQVKSRTPTARQRGDAFTCICTQTLGIECVREHRFHPTRRWRFDYAFPACRVAVEIDGGVWTYGRHNRASGYLADMEKFNEAAALGWIILKFTPQEQFRAKTLELIKKALEEAKSRGNATLSAV